MSATSFPAVLKLELTPEQKDWVSRYLVETRDAVVGSVTGFTAPEWEFKTDAGRWSIADILEHLVLVEDAINGNVRCIDDAPDAPSEWVPAQVDHFILTEIPKRPAYVADSTSVRKNPLPSGICPTNRWSGDEALALFVDKRNQNLQMVGGLSQRGRVIAHPVCGPWDGYQWLLAAGAHCSRHVGQIREVKEDKGFPTAASTTSVLPVE